MSKTSPAASNRDRPAWLPPPESAWMGLPIGLAVALVVWLLVVNAPGIVHSLELEVERRLLQDRGPREPAPGDPKVFLVAQDDDTYRWMEEHRGQAPGTWSRDVHAAAVERLRELGVAAIGFDFLFDFEREGTDEFARVLGQRPDTAIAMVRTDKLRTGDRGTYESKRLDLPLAELREVARVGIINTPVDPDERVRRYFRELRTGVDGTGGLDRKPTLAIQLARIARPEGAEAREAALPLDGDEAFLLDYLGPSPAFELVSLHELLDPVKFHKLGWQDVLAPADLDPEKLERVSPSPLGRGAAAFTLRVSPPDLEVEALAVPLAPGPWADAAGRGALTLDGLQAGLPYDLFVARKLGPGSYGVLSRTRLVPGEAGPLDFAFPELVGPVAGRVTGSPAEARVVLSSLGAPSGEATYREHLEAVTATSGAFETPSAVGVDFYTSVNGAETGPASRSPEGLALAGPPHPAPPGGEIVLPLGRSWPGLKGVAVDAELALPPYRATHRVAAIASGVDELHLPRPAGACRILLEGPEGRGVMVLDKRQAYRDAVAIVGPTSLMDHDFVATPFDHISAGSSGPALERELTPGVEIHAHAVHGLLSDHVLRGPTGMPWMNAYRLVDRFTGQLALLVLLLVMAGGLGVAMKWAMPRGGVLVFGASALAYLEWARYRFAAAGEWWHVVVPVATLTITYVAVLWYNYSTVDAKRRRIRKAFEHYLDPDIVKELEQNPDALELGGTMQTVTCFFSDIEGFSTFSEKMTPPELVDFINEYLTAMSDVLKGYGGWIDKFIGDAIVAVFNAPRNQPDHAARCLRAALDLKAKEARLREVWAARGLPQVRTRIGINTGGAVVGNVGTESTQNYTILGDAVNLAARLEALNKSYGIYLMIGENTYAEVKDQFEARELDLVRVKGKNVPAVVYQVEALAGEASARFMAAQPDWGAALAAYRAQRFDEAEALFGKVLERLPHDGPSKTYLKRIELLRKLPPPADWDGVWTMEHK